MRKAKRRLPSTPSKWSALGRVTSQVLRRASSVSITPDRSSPHNDPHSDPARNGFPPALGRTGVLGRTVRVVHRAHNASDHGCRRRRRRRHRHRNLPSHVRGAQGRLQERRLARDPAQRGPQGRAQLQRSSYCERHAREGGGGGAEAHRGRLQGPGQDPGQLPEGGLRNLHGYPERPQGERCAAALLRDPWRVTWVRL
jgi:hypothetical protein